jgi:hypothetical protein
MYNFDNLAKSPKFRHACEGRHPNYLKILDSRLRGNDAKGRFKTFYETINFQKSEFRVLCFEFNSGEKPLILYNYRFFKASLISAVSG